MTLLANSAGTYLGEPGMEPLFEFLDDRAAVVFVHPAQPPGPSVEDIPIRRGLPARHDEDCFPAGAQRARAPEPADPLHPQPRRGIRPLHLTAWRCRSPATPDAAHWTCSRTDLLALFTTKWVMRVLQQNKPELTLEPLVAAQLS